MKTTESVALKGARYTRVLQLHKFIFGFSQFYFDIRWHDVLNDGRFTFFQTLKFTH